MEDSRPAAIGDLELLVGDAGLLVAIASIRANEPHVFVVDDRERCSLPFPETDTRRSQLWERKRVQKRFQFAQFSHAAVLMPKHSAGHVICARVWAKE